MSESSRLLVFFLFAITALFSQDKPANPAKPTPADANKQAYVVEHFLLRAQFEADGTGVREITTTYKVISDAGVQGLAVLNFTYPRASENVEVVYVRVHEPDGAIVNTPDYNIQDMPADVSRTAPLYSDIHEKHVAVKALGVGDTLEYQVRFHISKPEIPSQFWLEYTFTTNTLVKDEQVEVSVPASKPLKVSSPTNKPEIKEADGRRIYSWHHANLNQPAADPDDADETSDLPSISLSTFSSWEEIGNWYASLQRDAIKPTPEITAKAAELTKGLTTDHDKIEAIYNYVALQVHYIGLDFGIGRYQPHMAEDVLENSYGDCKDKHTLFAALMKAAGYDVWPVLIHASRKLAEDVPSPAQFNHVISVVALGDQRLWVDTTPGPAPMGLLLIGLRDKEVLVIPTGKAPMLAKTPAEPPFPQEFKVNVEGKLSTDDVYTGHFTWHLRGDNELLYRAAFRSVAPSKWQELEQSVMRSLTFAGDVSNVQVSSPSDLSQPFSVSYDYTRKEFGDWANHQFFPPLPPSGFELYSYLDKRPKKLLPLGGVGDFVYTSRFELPSGYTLQVPQDVDVVEPFAEFHEKSEFKDGALITTRRVVVKKPEVSLSDWDALKKFSKSISDQDYRMIPVYGVVAGLNAKSVDRSTLAAKFNDGVEALQKRDPVHARELFEEIIAADPKFPGAHFNLGVALASRGKLDDALEEYAKEEEVTPTDERAYRTSILLYSALNRRDDAIDQARALLKVNPKNRDAAIQLSDLLVADGEPDDAETVLQDALKLAPDNEQLELKLGTIYMHDDQRDLAVAALKKAAEPSDGIDTVDVMTLNDAAYTLADSKINLNDARRYAEAAVARAEANSAKSAIADPSSADATNLAAIWDTLGWVYFQAGELKRAESYLHAAWTLMQNADVGDHLGQLYEKEGRKKDAIHQ
ncbi:MAG TPA: DUF3857 domain-containing protein [Candidatus Koribacter sp.]